MLPLLINEVRLAEARCLVLLPAVSLAAGLPQEGSEVTSRGGDGFDIKSPAGLRMFESPWEG